MRHRLLLRILVVAAFFSAAALTAAPSRFEGEVAAWREKHAAVFNEANALSLQGQTGQAARLLAAHAGMDGSPAANLAVATALYSVDRHLSYALHQKAWRAQPDEPAAILAMALEHHRVGEYSAAIPLYRRHLSLAKQPQWSALLADCLLRLGDERGAIRAWRKARHATNRNAIDFAIHQVYGDTAPAVRRAGLIQSARNGDHDAVTDLVLLDLAYDTDWWNRSVYAEGLDRDLALAAELLGEADPRYIHLVAYAKVARIEAVSREQVRIGFLESDLILRPNATLPVDSRVARAALELAIRTRAETPARLWEWHQAGLRERLANQDRAALATLTWLATAVDPDARIEFTRLGWKDWADGQFAFDYLIDLARTGELTLEHPDLIQAVGANPTDPRLQQLRLSLATQAGKVTHEMLLAAINAEYHSLSIGMLAPDSTTLAGLFERLAKHRDPAPPKVTRGGKSTPSKQPPAKR